MKTLFKIALGLAVVLFVIAFIGSIVDPPTKNQAKSLPSATAPVVEQKLTPETQKQMLLRDVKLDFRWRKEAFDTVMMADFTIKNPTKYGFKDFAIKCTHYAPSGTIIDSNTQTVYQAVHPASTKKIKQFNMGFIDPQVSNSGCEITDLVPLG